MHHACVLFVQAKLEDIEALVDRVREVRMRDILKQGVAYLHEGTHEEDYAIVQTLFDKGAIQVGQSCLCMLLRFVRFYQQGLYADACGQRHQIGEPATATSHCAVSLWRCPQATHMHVGLTLSHCTQQRCLT